MFKVPAYYRQEMGAFWFETSASVLLMAKPMGSCGFALRLLKRYLYLPLETKVSARHSSGQFRKT